MNINPHLKQRLVTDYKKLQKMVHHFRGLGLRIVLTQGTYDMVHIGHARYLGEAKEHGDVLIVGIDSDEKVRARKGPDRPIVPQEERLEMVSHLKPVDVVVLKPHKAVRWSLIKIVRPDVLIATKETYSPEDLHALKQYCQKVTVLESKAVTTTSAKIRRLQISTAKKLEQELTPRIMNVIAEVLGDLQGKAGIKTPAVQVKKGGKK
ncbi:MAG: adenylyltransferase/cytidyltransferase family protein [bacterium]